MIGGILGMIVSVGFMVAGAVVALAHVIVLPPVIYVAWLIALSMGWISGGRLGVVVPWNTDVDGLGGVAKPKRTQT